jgi:hypothetical protein
VGFQNAAQGTRDDQRQSVAVAGFDMIATVLLRLLYLIFRHMLGLAC